MSYKITIPKPCSEDWNKMTVTQKGAFCQSCSKEVIDFTNTTKRELSGKITKGQHICGRFRPEQLNIPLPNSSQNKFRHHAVLLGFTSLLALSTPVVGQQDSTLTPSPQHFVVGRIAPQPVHIPKENHTLKGIVKDFNNRPLSGATILLEGRATGTTTNEKGEFSITIAISENSEKHVLWVTKIGYEIQKISIDKKIENLTIEMVEEITILGEIAIQEFPKKNKDTVNKVKDFFRKKHTN